MSLAPGATSAPAVDRPILELGPHRSGTTLLYRTLARQAHIGFLTKSDHQRQKQLEPEHVESLRAEDPAFFEHYEEDAR